MAGRGRGFLFYFPGGLPIIPSARLFAQTRAHRDSAGAESMRRSKRQRNGGLNDKGGDVKPPTTTAGGHPMPPTVMPTGISSRELCLVPVPELQA